MEPLGARYSFETPVANVKEPLVPFSAPVAVSMIIDPELVELLLPDVRMRDPPSLRSLIPPTKVICLQHLLRLFLQR